MKPFSLSLALVMVMALGAGCAPQKFLTPEEALAERQKQLNNITRVYPGKTPEEILMAADRIFRLADDDYKVMHSETSLQVHRKWMIYLVISAAFGTDTWTVETFPVESATKVVVKHSGQSSGVYAAPMPTSGGGTSAAVMTSPAMDNITVKPSIYHLFYARLDNLLGLREDWMTCRDAKRAFKGEGPLDPWCTVANDRLPDGRPSRVLYEEPKVKDSNSMLQ